MRRPFIVWLALLSSCAAHAGAQPRDGSFTLALTGDSIVTRRLSVYGEPGYLRLIELIRGADAAFTNLEVLFHDYESHPMHESGGTYMRADPALAMELAWAGFDLVSRANNHAGDYGVAGMRLTTKHVAEAGLVHAGVGESLAEAREAKFLETGGARVALVSAASTFPDHSRAGRSRDDVPPRPGLSPLRYKTMYVVTGDQLEVLQSLARAFDARSPVWGAAAGEGAPETVRFLGRQFVAGERVGLRTEPLKEDVEEIAAVVRSASRLADYTIVSVHAHEGDGDRTVPAQFLVAFAHAMIDAGADVFVGHGPHVLRGIEIYKGRPILYSLGDFIFQNETLLRLPSENYEALGLDATAQVADFNERRYEGDTRGFPADPEIWESVVAVPRWEAERLAALTLHPITLGHGTPPAVRGRPMLATGELACRIIANVAARSRPFGTKVEFQRGVGVVALDATTPTR